MQFRAEHIFAAVHLQQFESCYFDEAFNEALCHSVHMQRTVVQLRRDGDVLHRVVQIFPERAVPAPVAKLLGAERLGYTEHLRYTFGSYAGTFHIVSSVLADKVHAQGTFHFADDGQGGVRRVVEGEVRVQIFALGGAIERFIVADVQKSYDAAATFTERHLAAQRAGSPP